MGEDITDWCAEHKRDKPCKVCEEHKTFMRKLVQMPDEMRSSIFAPVWPMEKKDD